MKFLAAIFILCGFAFGQATVMPIMGTTAPGGGGGCTPTIPSMTSAWQGYNASNVCTSGCGVTGHTVTTAADSIDGRSLTNSGTPTITVNALNSQPAFTFNGASTLATGTDVNSTTVTYYAIVNPTNRAATMAITGHDSNQNIEWRLDTNGKQQILSQQVALVGTSTTAIATGTYTAIAFTYNSGTGAYVFYVCAAGTCTSDGSGTSAQTLLTTTTLEWGSTNGGIADQFVGSIADFGVKTTVDTTAITAFGAYANCKYGL